MIRKYYVGQLFMDINIFLQRNVVLVPAFGIQIDEAPDVARSSKQ